ncbi:MAG TPA: hypothetical protein VN841_14820 [Bryobacteraceae bacterium]|nr:hypothetical protein [Bryobacteraceae bacterium]
MRHTRTVFLCAALIAAPVFLHAQGGPAAAPGAAAKSAEFVPPRTADGKPDLQGVWETRNAAAFDITEITEGHEIPYRPEALEKEQKGPRVDPIAHCAMPGVPRITYMPYPIQIMQRPGYVIFMYEYLHDQRIVPTNTGPTNPAREHLDGVDFWLGDSLGRWEGDTLVVDVTNLDERSWLDSARHTHSDALHVVERYSRTGPNTIRYEATIEDPKMYTRPWKIVMPLHLNKEAGFELREQECTEGDDGRPIHPPYRPAPHGDVFEFPRKYPSTQGASK